MKKGKVEFSIHGPMISGQHDAQIRRYKKIQGEHKTWYVSLDDNAGDHIYCTPEHCENEPGYKGFQGFGGATLRFELEDGTVDNIKGPWHSNSDALYCDTKHDIRDKHITQGIIAKERIHKDYYTSIYKKIIHYDIEPVIGLFNRIEDIAQQYANDNDCDVYYAVRSDGGGSSGCCKPIKTI
jgi:hypothetical protein